jgi:hypothetical protein
MTSNIIVSGHNTTQELARGYLDPSHTSSLYVYWINLPTPWPFLLFSILLSLLLGYRGWRGSIKSWHPVNKKKKEENAARHEGVNTSQVPELKAQNVIEITSAPASLFYTDPTRKACGTPSTGPSLLRAPHTAKSALGRKSKAPSSSATPN